jgi:hypothetical protein
MQNLRQRILPSRIRLAEFFAQVAEVGVRQEGLPLSARPELPADRVPFAGERLVDPLEPVDFPGQSRLELLDPLAGVAVQRDEAADKRVAFLEGSTVHLRAAAFHVPLIEGDDDRRARVTEPIRK